MELTISHISPGFHVYLHLVNSCLKFWRLNSDGEQGITQWWEHSPPTDVVRAQIPASTPYVGSVCCWFSPLLREVFLRVLRFSPLLKKPPLPNSNSTRTQVDEEPLCGSATPKIIIYLFYLFIRCFCFFLQRTLSDWGLPRWRYA